MAADTADGPQTATTYRDAFVLILEFAEERLGKAPAAMAQPTLCRISSWPLAAPRSFFKFTGHWDVASLQVIERTLDIPVNGSSVRCSAT